MKHLPLSLNFRDLGGLPKADGSGVLPHGLYMRSGKLSIFSKEQCAEFCRKHNIKCVIDLRTLNEASEFPDPLPSEVAYHQLPLLTDATIGITHETGSDPMDVLRKLRNDPEKLRAMMPDMKALYTSMSMDNSTLSQINRAIEIIQDNASRGAGTLIHCTAGKDRTGVVIAHLLHLLEVSDQIIIQDYLRTNRSAFLPTLKKCFGIYLLTRDMSIVRYAYHCFMADKRLIKIYLDSLVKK